MSCSCHHHREVAALRKRLLDAGIALRMYGHPEGDRIVSDLSAQAGEGGLVSLEIAEFSGKRFRFVFLDGVKGGWFEPGECVGTPKHSGKYDAQLKLPRWEIEP